MTEARSDDRDRLARAVRESLAAYASPAMTERLIRLALLRAGETAVPAGGARLREFVTHLCGIVESELGAEEADMVERGIEAILARAPALDEGEEISQVQPISHHPGEHSGPRAEDSEETECPPPVSSGANPPNRPRRAVPSLVVAASSDPSRIARVQRLVGSETAFRGAGDAMALLDVLESCSAPLVVVVDCQRPAVRPATLAALAPEFPTNTRIVLWGVETDEADELHALTNGALVWQQCASESSDRELAALLSG